MLQQFENLNRGDVNRTLAELTANAPAVKQAQAKLETANRDLDQAELNLRYCDIIAEIDGGRRCRAIWLTASAVSTMSRL